MVEVLNEFFIGHRDVAICLNYRDWFLGLERSWVGRLPKPVCYGNIGFWTTSDFGRHRILDDMGCCRKKSCRLGLKKFCSGFGKKFLADVHPI